MDVDVPRNAVIGGLPVYEVRRVRGAAAPLDAAVRHAIAGRQRAPGKLRVTHGKRAVVGDHIVVGLAFIFPPVARRLTHRRRSDPEHIFAPSHDGGGEFFRDGRLLGGDVLRLTGIGDHVVEHPATVEPVGLRACADLAVLVREDEAWRQGQRGAEQQRRQIDAVEGFGADARHAGERGERGEEIDRAGDVADHPAGFDLARPPHEERRTHAAFIDGAFAPLHPAGPTKTVRTVVGKINHNGVFAEAQCIKFSEHAAHVPVLVFQHRVGAARMVGVFLRRIGRELDELGILEIVPVFFRCGPRRVRGGKRNVTEKGFRAVAVDEVEGLVGAKIDDVAALADHLAIVLQRWVEVFAPMTGRVPVVFVETAGHGVIGPLAAVVPFAEGARGVTARLKGVGEGFLVGVQTFESGGDAAHAAARMIATGEKLGPGRRAHRANIIAIKLRTVAADGVDVGRAGELVAVDAVVAPTGIVGEEDNDVRRTRRCGGGEGRAGREQQGSKGEDGA